MKPNHRFSGLTRRVRPLENARVLEPYLGRNANSCHPNISCDLFAAVRAVVVAAPAPEPVCTVPRAQTPQPEILTGTVTSDSGVAIATASITVTPAGAGFSAG